MSTPSFPRQKAITRSFRLGVPRSFVVSDDRLVFARSSSGTDPVNSLWVHEREANEPRCVVDAAALIMGDENLPAAERARRERMREASSGITAFTTNTDATIATFVISGVPYTVNLVGEPRVTELPTPGPAIDPRLNHTGTHVAFAAEGGVHVVELASHTLSTLAEPEHVDDAWGLADFISAEELDRIRGLWWIDDAHVLAQRTDESSVQVWFTANPAEPAEEPIRHRYPAAGTPNAHVSLWVLGLDGSRTEVVWDHDAHEYLATVDVHGGLVTLGVLDRAQRSMRVLGTDATAVVEELAVLSDDVWLDIFGGVPARASDGALITIEADHAADTNRLCIDRTPVTPAGLQVFAVADITDHGIIIIGTNEPSEQHAYRVHRNGAMEDLSADAALTSVRASDHTMLTISSAPSYSWAGHEIASYAQQPVITARPHFHVIDDLHVAVLTPTNHVGGKLPIVMAPYGGPHHHRVVRHPKEFLSDQWLADQGYLVIVADGRGTGARGPAWDRSISGDLATFALEDQVRALHGVAALYPELADTSRVGIHGWSFGGYLAALAVLDRPDVFHVAVAGAPVTDWALYDTGYTERYLGSPQQQPEQYTATSLLARAPKLQRPLMLIHGLADDNVVAAHTLQLSAALLAAGKPHTVLPLTGVTHMTPQEEIAENLLLLQLEFLNQTLQP